MMFVYEQPLTSRAKGILVYLVGVWGQEQKKMPGLVELCASFSYMTTAQVAECLSELSSQRWIKGTPKHFVLNEEKFDFKEPRNKIADAIRKIATKKVKEPEQKRPRLVTLLVRFRILGAEYLRGKFPAYNTDAGTLRAIILDLKDDEIEEMMVTFFKTGVYSRHLRGGKDYMDAFRRYAKFRAKTR